MVDNSDRNSMEHRSAHTACRVFKGAWGCFPNERIRPLGPGCIAREVTVKRQRLLIVETINNYLNRCVLYGILATIDRGYAYGGQLQ